MYVDARWSASDAHARTRLLPMPLPLMLLMMRNTVRGTGKQPCRLAERVESLAHLTHEEWS